MSSRGTIWSNAQLISIANTIELSIGETGHIDSSTSWGNHDMVMPFNRLYLVESGGGILCAADQQFQMQPGRAYLLPAGLACSYECHSGMSNFFFHFNIFKSDRYDLFQNIGRIVETEFDPVMYQTLLRAYRGDSFSDAITVRHCLYRLIQDYLAKYHLFHTTVQPYSHHVISTIEYISDNLSARLRVEDLAKRLFISKNYLSALFRREVGISIGRYIDEQLIIAAQRALSQTDDSISVISAALGFCNQFYFSKAFSQITGISPQRYRQQTRY